MPCCSVVMLKCHTPQYSSLTCVACHPICCSVPGGGGGGGSTSSSSSVPVGAIVGGVAGGLGKKAGRAARTLAHAHAAALHAAERCAVMSRQLQRVLTLLPGSPPT